MQQTVSMLHDKTLYNSIGTGYNTTRQADRYLVSRLSALLQPEPNKEYLDIGCGTGNYTIALAAGQYHFTGVEPSAKMLNLARTRSSEMNWLEGSAENIPAADHSFHGAMATLTVHHWLHLEKAFAELFRVLKNKGRIVLFSSTPAQMQGYWLHHYFPQMLQNSMLQMPGLEQIQSAAEKAGFKKLHTEKYFVQNDLSDLFLYAGKNRPALYLNENVRKGISSFAALSVKEEVQTGLQRLEHDISTHAIDKIISNYTNDDGDYLFITIEK